MIALICLLLGTYLMLDIEYDSDSKILDIDLAPTQRAILGFLIIVVGITVA